MARDESPAIISIVIVVGVRLYREGLATALAGYPHLSIERSMATLQEAHAAIAATPSDVIIVDVSLPNVCAAMRDIREQCPRCRIVAFAVRDDIAAILDYAASGADGFVTVNGSVAELVEAIERTAAGELLCSPKMAAQLLRRAAHHDEAGKGSPLTLREQQVAALLKKGLSNKDIASALGIAEATVKNHVHHVLEKLQVSSRGQAAATIGLR